MIGGSGLTPALAIDYVRELSADVRAVVVLDARGEPLAGPPELAGPARALLDAGGDAAELEAGSESGVVCAVRSSTHAAVAICGRFAIGGVVREDLRAALGGLEGRGADVGALEAGGADAAALEGRGANAGALEAGGAVAGALDARGADAGAGKGRGPDASPDRALLNAAEALISAVQRGSAA
jgi:hypothetical protein